MIRLTEKSIESIFKIVLLHFVLASRTLYIVYATNKDLVTMSNNCKETEMQVPWESMKFLRNGFYLELGVHIRKTVWIHPLWLGIYYFLSAYGR